MAWNEKHENEARYPEPDLQAAYQHFKDLSVFYEVQVARKYKFTDCSPVQDAWNTYLKLRKQHGYSSGSSVKKSVSFSGSDRTLPF